MAIPTLLAGALMARRERERGRERERERESRRRRGASKEKSSLLNYVPERAFPDSPAMLASTEYGVILRKLVDKICLEPSNRSLC
jgi:hypothetical protein